MSSQTPSQTVGPYFAIGLTPQIFGRKPLATSQIATADMAGTHITLSGRVLDGEGNPVEDAMIEIWQADAEGRYAHPADRRFPEGGSAFRGFGRTGTTANGEFSFETVKPGPVRGPGNAWQAPHLNLIVFARGLLTHVYTRIYFDDENEKNENDSILALVEPARRGSLIARKIPRSDSADFRFDIHLQGSNETVFLEA